MNFINSLTVWQHDRLVLSPQLCSTKALCWPGRLLCRTNTRNSRTCWQQGSTHRRLCPVSTDKWKYAVVHEVCSRKLQNWTRFLEYIQEVRRTTGKPLTHLSKPTAGCTTDHMVTAWGQHFWHGFFNKLAYRPHFFHLRLDWIQNEWSSALCSAPTWRPAAADVQVVFVWSRFSTPVVGSSLTPGSRKVCVMQAGFTHSDPLFRSVGHLLGDRKPGVSVQNTKSWLHLAKFNKS